MTTKKTDIEGLYERSTIPGYSGSCPDESKPSTISVEMSKGLFLSLNRAVGDTGRSVSWLTRAAILFYNESLPNDIRGGKNGPDEPTDKRNRVVSLVVFEEHRAIMTNLSEKYERPYAWIVRAALRYYLTILYQKSTAA